VTYSGQVIGSGQSACRLDEPTAVRVTKGVHTSPRYPAGAIDDTSTSAPQAAFFSDSSLRRR
jgi:hypothetical protein